MSSHLWKYYLEDDADSFRLLLEEAGIAFRSLAQKSYNSGQGNIGATVGSPGATASNLPSTPNPRRSTRPDNSNTAKETRFQEIILSRLDINRRDAKGLTILHYAASSASENAISFATALVTHPLIDLYVQDLENGWTALHRAFYFGNITIARAIIERDAQDAIGYNGAVNSQAGTLIKIKDKDGNGPYDLLTETIQDRTLPRQGQGRRVRFTEDDEEEDMAPGSTGDGDDDSKRKCKVNPLVNVQGDEFFTFGSNKNLTLGFNDEDDRQRPERVVLKRPDHLYQRFYREYIETTVAHYATTNPAYAEKLQAEFELSKQVSELPSVVRSRPVIIQDIQMSKFHTAVLTNDPESNLYMCGYGVGGRLGTGTETTQFNFACVEGGVLARKRLVAVALGQNHSLAVSDEGDIFSWGSNTFGQLGFALAKTNPLEQEPVQTVPRQIYGPLKREIIVGVAASRIHSVAYTNTSLYTFGKNEGQLGIVYADARSLDVQITPRRVGASLFSSAIHSVSAIDRATVCLLENHEVWVFANYGWVKMQFPLEGFSNYFLKSTFLTTNYEKTPNQICKITCGGDTICALSSAGEVYTVTVNQPMDPGASQTSSTTNPNKIRGALTAPNRVWSLKKVHMNARDVDVDQDGSIILTTEAGSVWRRIRRAKIKTTSASEARDAKAKDYKFIRIPSVTRVIAVRASAFGGYCAIRKDCDVTRTQIAIDDPAIWSDVFSLLAFRDLPATEDSDTENPRPAFWKKYTDLELLTTEMLRSKDLEAQMKDLLLRKLEDQSSTYDMVIGTTISDVRIPIHQFIFSARSRVIREALAEFRDAEYFSITELLSIHAGDDGKPLILFQGLDFLTITNLVLYLYTDAFVGFWQHTRAAKSLAFRYRQVRIELMKVATRLDLRNLESATRRVISSAEPSLATDMELAITDTSFFENGDIIIQLADKAVPAHSALLSRRCPFFEGLFEGRAGGAWLSGRRGLQLEDSDAISIDLQHIEWRTFELVLRHLYADSGPELFDHVITDDRDEFIDTVMDVLSVANELMLDRLSQACQKVLGRHVTIRNACQLLNAIAPSSVTEFKSSCLEYICLSLESMLVSHHLDELDEDVLLELDHVVRENQLAAFPVVRSGVLEGSLLERHPELAAMMDRNRRSRLDALILATKYQSAYPAFGTSFEDRDQFEPSSTASRRKGRSRPSPKTLQGLQSPILREQKSTADMMFNMDEEGGEPRHSSRNPSISGTPIISPTPEGALSPDLEALDSQNASLSTSSRRQPMNPSFKADLLGAPALPVPQTPPAAGRTPSAPWGASPLLSTKLEMKDIMAQASSSRVSNISLGLSPQDKTDERSVGSFAHRISQKARRKQQQQIQLSDPPGRSQVADNPASNRDSPWKQISNTPKRSLRDLEPSSPHATPPKPSPHQTRSATTPQLTMRQTLANTGPSNKQKASSTTTTNTNRSVSNPQTSTSSVAAAPKSPQPDGPGMTADMSTSIPIQSIRHSQRPGAADTSSSPGASLAAILAQQAAEKVAVRDAAAKRSLQDIQAEQEFQEWWDAESRRVVEEEEAAAAAAAMGTAGRARGKSGRGRGGNQRGSGQRARGRGRGREGVREREA